jgi:DNA-binding NtrC family response regulator
MNNGAHVLVVSRDQMLLQTRTLILGAYFQVEPAGRISEAEAAMARTAFDLVILCYSLPDDEFQKLIQLCKLQDPAPKILILLAPGSGRQRSGGDGEFTLEHSPYELLKKTAEMVGFPLKPMGRASHSS